MNNLSPILIQKVKEKAREVLRLAKIKFPKLNNFNFYDISFSQKYFQSEDKLTCGMAFGNDLIIINPLHLINKTDEALNDTVPHEMAHLFVDFLFNNVKNQHGIEWEIIMKGLGINTDIFIWKCGCRTLECIEFKHNKFKNSLHKCNNCEQEVIFVGIKNK